MDSPGVAILGGLAGSVVFLMVVYMGLASGMTRMDFLYTLGSMVSPRSAKAPAQAVGFVVHMMMGALFGLAHVAVLEAVGVAGTSSAIGWRLGLGAIHGMAILALMPSLLTAMHPLVREARLGPPGVALTGFGSLTPVGSLMAHVAFGAVVAAAYATTL